MAKYLDSTGVQTLWNKIKSKSNQTTTKLLPPAGFILNFDSFYTTSVKTTEQITVSSVVYNRITSTSTEQNSIKVYGQPNLAYANGYLINNGNGARGIIIRASNMMQTIVFEATSKITCTDATINNAAVTETIGIHTVTTFQNVLIKDTVIFSVPQGAKIAKLYFAQGYKVPTTVTTDFNNRPKTNTIIVENQTGVVSTSTNATIANNMYFVKAASISFDKSSCTLLNITNDYTKESATIQVYITRINNTSGQFAVKIVSGNIPQNKIRLYQNVNSGNNVVELWLDCSAKDRYYQIKVLSNSNYNSATHADTITLNNLTSIPSAQTPQFTSFITAEYITNSGSVNNANHLVPLQITTQSEMDSINSTTSFYENKGLVMSGSDSVGLHVHSNIDRFQIVTHGDKLWFRQQESANTFTDWLPWYEFITNNQDQTINSTKTFTKGIVGPKTDTYINGAKGVSAINYPNSTGFYTLCRFKTLDGATTISSHSTNSNEIIFGYTSDATINANTNKLDKSIKLDPKSSTMTVDHIKTNSNGNAYTVFTTNGSTAEYPLSDKTNMLFSGLQGGNESITMTKVGNLWKYTANVSDISSGVYFIEVNFTHSTDASLGQFCCWQVYIPSIDLYQYSAAYVDLTINPKILAVENGTNLYIETDSENTGFIIKIESDIYDTIYWAKVRKLDFA